ncbi:zinc finger protein 883-like isoform X2 [Malaya genurostris]|uniref:zinc finger protein 883-like isoform X2 n=1 Tax=Malaya genurostris TaxID=325434 RepID=UPI0026F39D58|nr:zinc finger protein 883-like isoform X2 [Malaya genurostris]
MPCVVPTCNDYGGTLKRFPDDAMLAGRWLDAIQLGSGVVIETVNDLKHLEVCNMHFVTTLEHSLLDCNYQEPSKFTNCDGSYVEVSSCRLCLAFHRSDDMVEPESRLREKQLISHVDELFNIKLRNDDLLTLICHECFARIEILLSIKQKTAATEVAYQQLVRIGQEQASKVVKHEAEAFPDNIVKFEVHLEDSLDSELYIDEKDSNWEPDVSDQSLQDHKNHRTKSMKIVKCKIKNKRPIRVADTIKRKCYICVSVFADASELLSHLVEIHTTNTVYRCEECSLDIPVLTMFNRHLSRHDAKERPYKCNDCALRFVSPMQRKHHENATHGGNHRIKKCKQAERQIMCEICGKKFRHKCKLNDHIQRVHLKVGIPKCEKCGKTFTTKTSLERHMLLHTNEKPYACDQCDESFRRLLNLRHHKSMVHEGKNPHICPECNVEFQGYQALYWHRKNVHLGGKEAKQQNQQFEVCKLCNIRLEKISELIDHVKREHGDDDYPYIKCSECPRTFINSQRLYQHKSIHTDKFACTICGARHTNSALLQYHMDKKHPDGRTFQCPICGKTYNTTRALTTHVALHTKKKKFICDFCQKPFGRKCELIIHRRTHTGEKPLQCVGCLKRFGDDGTYYKHRKICKAMKAKSEPQFYGSGEEDFTH